MHEFHAKTKLTIDNLIEQTNQITLDANKLTKALSGDSKTQGDYGEFKLEMLLQNSGLEENIHYKLQKGFTVKSEDDVSREIPDAVIYLPQNRNIIIDSKSGYSGAGKTKGKKELIKEVNENIRTYGIGDHKHIAEINQELSKIKNIQTEVFFAANILPVERGILSNIYIDANEVSQNDIYDILQKRFNDEHFIQLLPMNEIPSSREVVCTNNLVIGLKKGYKENKLCIVSVLDNLVKGAAGQAIQNMNLLYGFKEDLSL